MHRLFKKHLRLTNGFCRSRLFKFCCVILMVSLSSCFSQKEITYKGISNINYRTDKEIPQITFDLIINNPNNWGLKVSDLTTNVTVANRMIGTAIIEKPIRIHHKNDVTIPMVLNLSMADVISLLPTGLSLFGQKSSVNTQVEGNVTVKKFIFKRKYLFNFKQDVQIK